MHYSPGVARIVEECIELFGLANALFVSKEFQGNLSAYPYIAKGLEENGRRLIIEKLLSIAIKLRFLDDQHELLKQYDRSNAGILIVNDEETKVGLREALNKIIHNKSLEIVVKQSNITVTDHGTPVSPKELKIPEGCYSGFSIFVAIDGCKGRKSWKFHTELTVLLSEIFRVVYIRDK